MKALRQKLFTTNGYDKYARPKENQSEQLLVRLDYNLKSIHNLDEVAQTFTTTAILGIFWTDDALKWNVTEYGGIHELILPQTEIWKPELVLSNGVHKLSSQLRMTFYKYILTAKEM